MAKKAASAQSTTEEFSVSGEKLVNTVKQIIREGNARSLTVKSKSGMTLLHIPLTFGAIGAILAPYLVILGAIAALVTQCTIVVEKKKNA